MAVDAPAPGMTLVAGSRVEGFGWAMAGSAIREITVDIAGRLLCVASIGIERPDLVEPFPAYADAGRAGFHFQGMIDPELRGEVQLTVKATAVDGRQVRQVIPVRIEADAGTGGEPAQPNVADPRSDAEAETQEIRCHLDDATLGDDGEIYVFGWALAQSGIESIKILLDEAELCDAVVRLKRTDIAESFPQVAGAGESGFGLHRHLEGQYSGDHTITAVIRVRGGGEQRLSREVHVVPRGRSEPVEEHMRLAIDLPVLPEDGAPFAVSGSLVIQGWVIARALVQHIAVSVDGVETGLAYYGIRREDVAAVYADWPEALHCGFGISVPAKALKSGKRVITLTAVDRAGLTLRRSFDVVVDADGAYGTHERLRTLMSGAEIMFDRRILASRRRQPVFHVLLSLDAADVEFRRTRATLESLESQHYDRFDVRVVAPAGIDAAAFTEFLHRDFPALADRVLIAGLLEPADAAPAPDTFICPLYAGDRLGCDALIEIALAAGADPAIDFLYGDDRRADPETGVITAWLKPGWSPELLLSTNYVGRNWFAALELVTRAGLNTRDPAELLGAGIYELALRLTHAAHRVEHVPLVLSELTPIAPVTGTASIAAVETALRARGIEAEVLAAGCAGVQRIKRRFPKPELVSIVIPTRGTRDLICDCVASIQRYTRGIRYEIICVENIPAANQRLRRWLAGHADRQVSVEGPFNWSRFNNVGAAAADPRSDYLLFLNDDIEAIEPGWLDALLEHAQREDVGAVGPMLLYPDRRVQHAGMFMVEFGRGRHAFRFAEATEPGPFGVARCQRNVLAVTGACLLMRRPTLAAMGGFDEAHRIVNNDLDFCLRCNSRGLQVIYTPHARLIHHEMASRSSNDDEYDLEHFTNCWSSLYGRGDPFYSAALTRDADDYSADPEPMQVVFGGHPLVGEGSIRSILAIKLDHIGDFITSLPALRRLKRHFPEAKLCLLAGGVNLQLAHLEPSIDEVIEFNYFNPRSSLGQLDVSPEQLARLRANLASHRFDLAIDLRKHPDTRLLLRHVGARLTAGFDYRARFPWLDIAIEWDGDVPLNPKRQHVSDDLLRLVDAVRTSCDPDRQTIAPSAAAAWNDVAAANLPSPRMFQRPVVCVHAASGNPMRQWPEEHFTELVRLILEEHDVSICLIGGADEHSAMRSIWNGNDRHPSIYPLAGAVPLADLPQLLARCALFVGNNSGPQHIAAGLGIPTIGVHSGVVDAAEWAPIGPLAVAVRRNMSCGPCYLSLPRDCTRGLACLRQLLPRDVLAVCRKFLPTRVSNQTAGSAAVPAETAIPSPR